MAITTSTNGFFWDSIDHDRVYDAGSFENWLKKFFTSGVFTGDLQVTQSDALEVSVAPGYCNIDGKVQMFSSSTKLKISPGNATYPRIDNIVVERNNSDRDISLKVVKGTETSSTAAAPARAWNDTIKQLVLAQISVPAGATSITQVNIKDTRASELCGIVAGTVRELDFSQMQAQFDAYYKSFTASKESDYSRWSAAEKASFDTWFETIKNQLSTDVAGSLQNQLVEHEDRLALIEKMVIQNDISAPINLSESGDAVILVSDSGEAIVADWKYKYA